MRTWQRILFPILVVALVVLAIVFRNAIAGAIFGGCLLMVVPIYLFNRFMNTDEKSDFTDNENV